MVQVILKSSGVRQTKTFDVSATPAQAFASVDIDLSGSICNMNGLSLSVADLNTSFADLGVVEGSTITLSSVVKADCA